MNESLTKWLYEVSDDVYKGGLHVDVLLSLLVAVTGAWTSRVGDFRWRVRGK